MTPMSCDLQGLRSCSVMLFPGPGPCMRPGDPKAELHKEADLPQGAICTSQKSRDVAVVIRVIHVFLTNYFLWLPEV